MVQVSTLCAENMHGDLSAMHARRHRPTFTFVLQLALAALILLPRYCLGQQALAPEALTQEVARLASGAGTVFVGQIVSIHRTQTAVEVTFRVEQWLRGTGTQTSKPIPGQASASLLVLHEWAGLWPPGQQRYLPGARVLAFLHGVSPVGFASPVHGSEGLVPVLVQGAGRTPLVDLRRVAASVERGPQTPLPSFAQAAVPLSDLLPVIATHAPATGLLGVAGGIPAATRATNGLVRSLQEKLGSPQNSKPLGTAHHAAL